MDKLGLWSGVVLAAWCCHPAGIALADEVPEPVRRAYARDVRPLLAKYCQRCHGGSEPKADLALDRYADANAVLADRNPWRKVVEHLREGDMPPDGEPRPSDDQIEQIAAWLDEQLTAADRRAPRDPGRVTIRRLNRAEYNLTVRDLLGVDFRPAEDFPLDDIGYGFDNIGDVLAMPPILLEKYLTAAQAIADRAIIARPAPRVIVELAARQAEHSGGAGAAVGDSGWGINSNGELRTGIRTPADGTYVLKVTAYGQQAGNEPARMQVGADGQKLSIVDVTAVEAAPQVYELRTALKAGDHRITLAFINDFYQPKDPNPNNRDRNLVILSLRVEGPLEQAPAALPESHRRLFTREVTADNHAEVAREMLGRFATRAFRRPATSAEIERLVNLVAAAERRGDNFAEAIKLAVQAVLVSPHFLFRIELDPPAGEPIRTLNDFELATRLSYFLWSSLPDEELYSAALAGKLQDPAQRAAQARRMLRDPKSRALVDNFAGQWLQLRNLATIMPDKRLFPEFDDSLRAAMREETERFFAAVLNEDRSVLDFLDADFTFLNERLAKHYGIAGVQGSEFRRVALTGGQRGGVLTQASVLAVTSNPTRTSPVKRGKWVLENFLAAPPPPPPPGVPELVDTAAAAAQGTLRERMEQHRSKAECSVCHNRMDPLGFGLENYNAIGAWRSQDGPFKIDASGSLPGGKSFAGPDELRRILKSKQQQFVRCLAEKLLTYGLGRGLEEYDRATVADIAAQCSQQGFRFSSLVTGVIQSDAFCKRRAQGDTP